ncbi:hypothetical protein J2Z18_003094 [Paenibacillus lactis]|uniref:Uncharacterized protein n=1 Tax=Paenibacillus lactis TaxID=228574 RepID=A0ABS4FCK9_9BACL|nr:hypothetical protein [Paenibacillus lactis]
MMNLRLKEMDLEAFVSFMQKLSEDDRLRT